MCDNTFIETVNVDYSRTIAVALKGTCTYCRRVQVQSVNWISMLTSVHRPAGIVLREKNSDEEANESEW